MRRSATTLTAIALLIGTGPAMPAAADQSRPPRPPTTRPLPPPSGPQVMPVRPDRPGFQRGFAGRIRCESRNNNRRRCAVRTENRAVLIRQLGGRNCLQGRNWFFDRNSITVTSNCRGEFAFGFGNFSGYPYDRRRGPSTGAVIAGVAVAGGLMAALASSNRNRSSGGSVQSVQPADPDQAMPFPPGPPAAIVADFTTLPANARPAAQACMFEAARQVGVTGGTRVRHASLVSIEPGSEGWRMRSNLIATYPDGDRSLPMDCLATSGEVVELTFG